MAKRTTTYIPVQKPSASLTAENMRQGAITFKRRISELRQLDVSKFQSGSDPAILALQANIESSLELVFGRHTTNFSRYEDVCKLDKTHYYVMFSMTGDQPFPVSEIHEGLNKGKDRAIALLEQAVNWFNENLEDLGETKGGRALKAYDGLELHSEISRASSKLYRDAHYSNAVEAAVKALNSLVRLRSGLEQDGSSLMERAFNPSSPVLRFNDLLNQSDKDEQKGFMMLFLGAVSGLRNPRAHSFIEDDPEMALEFIAFVSLLAKLLDKSFK
jgi:uncharacterized protein (TIGR02391 family)